MQKYSSRPKNFLLFQYFKIIDSNFFNLIINFSIFIDYINKISITTYISYKYNNIILCYVDKFL